MRVLITGHTGLKGSLLSLILSDLGHKVLGVSNSSRPGSIADMGILELDGVAQVNLDIRDKERFSSVVLDYSPEIAIHLAAISTISEGLADPNRTFQVNVGGTLNFIEAMSQIRNSHSLIITSDKVYHPDSLETPHHESSPLGGKDPYSASKAVADFLSQQLLKSSASEKMVIARAGNVIGPFDMAPNRLMRDAQEAVLSSKPLVLRNPSFVRPWQDVRDVLSGYLSILNNFDAFRSGEAVNVGPRDLRPVTVAELVSHSKELLTLEEKTQGSSVEVANLLVSSEKLTSRTGWETQLDPRNSFRDSLLLFRNLHKVSNTEFKRSQILSFLGARPSTLLENAQRLGK